MRKSNQMKGLEKMKLVIAEKPSVAKAICPVLGTKTKKNGYMEGNGYIVSWCFGHLVGMILSIILDTFFKNLFKAETE